MAKVIGGKIVIANLNKAIKGMKEELTRIGMMKVGSLVLKKSKALVPMKTGNLMESGFYIWGGDSTFPGVYATGNFNTEEEEGKRVASDHSVVVSQIATSHGKKKKHPFVVIGHTAFYAVKEHEAIGEKHKIGQAKFLETAVKSSRNEIIKILKKHGKPKVKERKSN